MQRRRLLIRLGTVMLVIGAAFAQPRPAHAGSVTVTTDAEELNSDGDCSLREAIQAANTDATVDNCTGASGTDTISFSIGSGTQTITLTSTLAITSPVIIDGTTQPGFVAGGPGVPLIVITGTPADLLHFQAGSAGSTVKSLRLVNTLMGSLGRAIRLEADSITITGNYFHTDGTNSTGGDDTIGVLFSDSDNSTIGGPTTVYRNIFGGNIGIRLDRGSSNILRNNYFGLQPNATFKLAGHTGNNDAISIGYYDVGANNANNEVNLNVIVDFFSGLYLGPNAHDTLVTANKIGINTGGTRISNYTGIFLGGSDNNIIGGTTAADRNVVAGNYKNITVVNESFSDHAVDNTIQGNYIGVGPDGTTRTTAYVDNGTWDVAGIELVAGDGTVIGGTAPGSGNVISGNYYGIHVPTSDPTGTLVQGNKIGTDYTGTSPIIQAFGIHITDADVEIGGPSVPGHNLISGNDQGIFIVGSTGTTIYGNRIGLSALGNVGLPNSFGISLGGAAPTIAENWIGNNTSYGLFIDATSSVAGGSSDNCFTANGVHAVNSANSGSSAALAGNWWNSLSGPTHSGNPSGTGDAVTDYVTYSPFRTSVPAVCRPIPSDYDGDRMTDPAKFLPGTGTAWWFKSSTSAWDGHAMGGDVAEYVRRSDFDGDGKADPGKYVSAGQGLWYYQSSDATLQSVYMGSGTYTLLPGSDFDGDGISDPAKYLSTGAIWRLLSGGGGWVGTFIGTDASPAIPGSDYDGDGKADLAKYVPSAGAIWFYGSGDSAWHGVYIGSDGVPVPASDFDGDGITDMAKYLTGSNSLWYRRSSDMVWVGVYLGPGTFTYVPAGDFDGDGKTDPAKFDTVGKGLWWLGSSTSTWGSKYMGGEVYDIVN